MEQKVNARRGMKGHLTRIAKFIDGLPPGGVSLNLLDSRYRTLVGLFERFDNLQLEIELLGEAFEIQEREREQFETEYYRLDAIFNDWFDKLRPENHVNLNNTVPANATINLSETFRLPQMSLPSFSGEITEWYSFIELFDSLIHANGNISNVNKFFYLKASLKGDALNIIESLNTTDANYNEARQLLKDRYENKKSIIQTHLKYLFEMPDVRVRCISSLRNLIDCTNKHLAALRGIGERVDDWDPMLVYLLSSKLDQDTRRQVELHFVGQDMPTLRRLIAFLNQRCNALEQIEPVKSKTLKSFGSVVDNSKVGEQSTKHSGKTGCLLCKGDHFLYGCSKFLGMTPIGRYENAKKLNICINCLKPGHHARDCKARCCTKCDKKHHSLLHFNQSQQVADASTSLISADISIPPTTVPETSAGGSSSCSTVSLQSSMDTSLQVILYTGLIKVRDNKGQRCQCRALIDTGSQACFITEDCVRRLGLETKLVNVFVNGIGLSHKEITRFVDIEITSNFENFSMSIQALILPRITMELPQTRIDVSDLSSFSNLKLADPDYSAPGKIDVLLSNSVFTSILKGGVQSDKTGNVKALDTALGWIIGGVVKTCNVQSFFSTVSMFATHEVECEDFDLRKLWEMEEMPKDRMSTMEFCEQHFLDTHEIRADGRFYVELPFITSEFDFSFSKSFALSRFNLLEKRFQKNEKLKSMYTDFIADYFKMGFIEPVPSDEYEIQNAYYLPHHGVLKELSLTAKLRVVFDGTAAPNGCQSINSVLEVGPRQQNDLLKILLRFRTYRIALMADIERMFCQIRIKEIHRNFLRFFWRENSSEPLQIFRLISLPFGLKCSPYIAIRCLKEIAKIWIDQFPRACNFILSSFYVDDFIAGANSLDEAFELVKELRDVCKKAGFNLRKWTSNENAILETIQMETVPGGGTFETFDATAKVLGLLWCQSSDYFFFGIKENLPTTISKRIILSQLAEIFDPFGWLGPVVVRGKIIIQELWVLKVGWDDAVPEQIGIEWCKLKNELKSLESIKINRFVGDAKNAYLCCFADASVKAYGACVYLVSNGKSELLMSKSRVAPLKVISLARLELCAAVLAARILKFVIEIMEIPEERSFLWTDSTIVLAWLAKPSYNWLTFVANRVSEVHTLVPKCKWFHIKSSENPADVISRGINPIGLVSNTLWWNGPSIILENKFDEENMSFFRTELDAKPMINTTCNLISVMDDLYGRISSYVKLINVQAWIQRFIRNYFSKAENRTTGDITVQERDSALRTLIKMLQLRHFSCTIDRLNKGENLKKNDPLLSLTPFLDSSGVLRVGGRLDNGIMAFETKHPIILPKNDKFVKLLVTYEHFRNHHVGVNALIAITRQTYWILNARTTIKRELRKCVVCYRFSPKRVSQLMGSLPKERTEINRAFYNVGIDLCGPFFVRPTRRRGNTTQKAYIALFVCFSTKAVHLEMVSDLTTETFLAALRRFVSRRGIPATIFTDNGTNFVGASRCIKEWYELAKTKSFKDGMGSELLNNRIEWRFIPARTPNFGGLWESHIKSMKACLLKCLKSEKPTFEEFQTIMTQVEGSLNSRPLCPTSNSVDELDVLTPGHFLIGTNLKGLPNQSEIENTGALTSRWKHLQRIFAHYWSRWTTEYLRSLNQRTKNKLIEKNVKVGDIGLLLHENLPPYKWPLCLVKDTVTGSDGLVRVLILKMGQKIFKRGITNFCKLPDFR